VTAQAIRAAGLTKVGLLGTAFTMQQDFYSSRLAEHGIETLIPDKIGQADVHRVIYDELCRNVMLDDSRARYREVMAALAERGAEGIVLGCTEIMPLVGQADSPVPVFDTTALHVQAAADWMLS
jgi:aspartate racemase